MARMSPRSGDGHLKRNESAGAGRHLKRNENAGIQPNTNLARQHKLAPCLSR